MTISSDEQHCTSAIEIFRLDPAPTIAPTAAQPIPVMIISITPGSTDIKKLQLKLKTFYKKNHSPEIFLYHTDSENINIFSQNVIAGKRKTALRSQT